MVDLLLTLSAFILISSTILPMVIQLLKESIEEKEKYAATSVLYEKLHDILIEKQLPVNQKIIKNDKVYEFIPSPDLKEVCIQFEDHNQSKQKVCEFLE
jgi:Na+-translocating ferredoxin:NAD+ oxidoreductase RnfG subunit